MSKHHLGRYGRNRRQRRSIRRRVVERDAWVCQLCGQPIDPDADPASDLSLTMDHIVLASDGGTFSLANLRAAHRACNMARADAAA